MDPPNRLQESQALIIMEEKERWIVLFFDLQLILFPQNLICLRAWSACTDVRILKMKGQYLFGSVFD